MGSVNRREFLKSTLGTAAMVAMLPQRQSRAANEKVIIGLMGCGGRGTAGGPDVRRPQRCRRSSTSATRTTAARPGTKQTIEKAQGKPTQVVQDFRRILDDKNVDALINATPDHWHALGTIMACQAGKDVYTEKPLAHNVWEGRKMIEAARKYKRVVQVGTQIAQRPVRQGRRRGRSAAASSATSTWSASS